MLLRATPIPFLMVLVIVFSSMRMSATPARAAGAKAKVRTNATVRACFFESLLIILILLEELHLIPLPAAHRSRQALAGIVQRVRDKRRSKADRCVAITTRRGTGVHAGKLLLSSTRLPWERVEWCVSSRLSHRSPAGHLRI